MQAYICHDCVYVRKRCAALSFIFLELYVMVSISILKPHPFNNRPLRRKKLERNVVALLALITKKGNVEEASVWEYYQP